MPPLEAEYETWPICPSKAATEAVNTMTPRSPSAGSFSAIASAASLVALKVPIRLILTTRSNCSSDSTLLRPRTRPGVPIPAQFTRTRSDHRSVPDITAARMASGSVTSVATKTEPVRFAASAPSEDSRSVITTLIPRSLRCWTVARPSPLVPPVTIADVP
jgi:hypothetical protein